MPLFSSTAGISARALGLTSGILSGAAAITSILGNQNGTTGTQLLVYFNAGTPGSSPVTDYQYSLNGGSTWNTFASPQTSSPLTISGLTNGTTYSVAIRPMQGLQPSVASNVSSGRPVALPTTPSITSITNDANGTTGTHISVAFTGGTGGTDSTTTFQFSTDNGSTWTNRTTGTTASPILITGLANGTSYNVRIRAVTSIGDFSAQSAASVGRPVALPGAPTISAITASTGQLSVAFSVGQAGTDAPATYEYSLDGGSTYFGRQSGTTASPIVITGVTDSTVANANKSLSPTYSVRIRSVTPQNHRSDGSAAVTPSATLPAAPTGLAASATAVSVTVTFTSAAAGSYAIANHQYSIDGGSNWATYSSGQEIASLYPSTSYTVLVRAVDVQGLAGPTASITRTTSTEVVNSPTINSIASSSTTSLTVAFTAASTGTYAVGGHEYSYDGGTTWTPAASNPFTIPGLTTDATYAVQLRAFSSHTPAGGTALRGASASASGQVNPAIPNTPTANFSVGSTFGGTAFSSMSGTSYGHVYIRISKPTYADRASLYIQYGSTVNEYTSVSHPGSFEDRGTFWLAKFLASNNLVYTYKARVGNRLSEYSNYTPPATWTTPKTGIAWNNGTNGNGVVDRAVVRTDSVSSTYSSCSNFRSAYTFGTVPSDPNAPGYIDVNTVSADFKCGALLCNPDSNGRVLRIYYGSSTLSYSAQITANFGSTYTTTTFTAPTAMAGSNISGKTVFVSLEGAGARLNASCGLDTSFGNEFYTRYLKLSGTQTTTGSLSKTAGVNWT